MTANPSSADTSGQPFNGLIQLAGIGATAFQSYEAAQVAQTATKKLNSKDLVYVVIGLGVLGVAALFVFKH